MIFKVSGYTESQLRVITVDAENAQNAVEQVNNKLGEGRITIIKVKQEKQRLKIEIGKKVKRQELEFFCRQMASLLSSGITILDALNAIAEQTEKPVFKNALLTISDNVKDGFSLSSSFQSFPNIFSNIFCSLIAAAEDTGSIDEIFIDLADHYNREDKFQRKIKQALAYPAIIMLLATIEVLGIFTFIIPRFAGLLQSSQVPLPKSTLFLLSISNNFGIIFIMLTLVLIGGGYLLRLLWSNDKSRKKIEMIIIKTPILGRLSKLIALARVCHTISLMIKVGIPINQVLSVTSRVSGYLLFADEINKAQEEIREGKSPYQAFKDSKWFTSVALKMIDVGEKSGHLNNMLEHTADLYDLEIDTIMQRIPTIAETSMLIIIGFVVLIVLYSIYSPIFSIYQTIK